MEPIGNMYLSWGINFGFEPGELYGFEPGELYLEEEQLLVISVLCIWVNELDFELLIIFLPVNLVCFKTCIYHFSAVCETAKWVDRPIESAWPVLDFCVDCTFCTL